MVLVANEGNTPGSAQGLRRRKRVRRREEIIDAARTLFIGKGIDATTMADIAAAADVSTPTIFNHFGSKDGVLIALIVEGSEAARKAHDWTDPPEGTGLAERAFDLLARVSSGTLDIAGKQVWRYAEAAAIRNPDTDFSREYKAVSQALVDVFAAFFAGFDLQDKSGAPCDASFLGPLFHDVWNPMFLDFITQPDMTLADHHARLRLRMSLLVGLIFHDDCIAAPKRRKALQ